MSNIKIHRTIAFYISDHGFGHVSRNIPIIRYILEAYEGVRVVVKTGILQSEFIESSLAEFKERLMFYPEKMDIGLVLKENSLDIDKQRLSVEVKKYVSSWNNRALNEIRFLEENNVELIISDIVPWIFIAANHNNIPSILISNFTWIDIYSQYLDSDLIKNYTKAYKLADKVFLYYLHMDTMKEYIDSFEEIGLCCRVFNEDFIRKVKRQHNKKIVFISVGRSVKLDKPIYVGNLNYDFIVTEGINIKGDNVVYLPKETDNTHDYIKASDYIISKAGWTTVSEILCAGKRCALLSRDSVAEDKATIENLKKIDMAIEVRYEDDFNIEEIINKLDKLNSKTMKYKFENNYKDISNKIMSILRE